MPSGVPIQTDRRIRPRNDPGQYDDLVHEWWRPDGVFAMLHWLARARGRLVPPATRDGAVLVDLGCGAGLLAPHVAGKGYRHIGIDLVLSAVRQAAGHGVAGAVGDVTQLPLPDACADVVCAGELLEHVPDLPAVVAQACRVLRPGGVLVLDTLAERMYGGAVRGIHDPALFVDPRTLIRLCASHGVALRVRGIRPALSDAARWLATRRGDVRIVPTWSTAVLYQGSGVKEVAA